MLSDPITSCSLLPPPPPEQAVSECLQVDRTVVPLLQLTLAGPAVAPEHVRVRWDRRPPATRHPVCLQVRVPVSGRAAGAGPGLRDRGLLDAVPLDEEQLGFASKHGAVIP